MVHMVGNGVRMIVWKNVFQGVLLPVLYNAPIHPR